MDCCKSPQYDFDFAIIGSGSAAFAAAIKATELGKSIIMIEKGTIGGTCVNFGCVPSKTLIRAAEAKFKAEQIHFEGLSSAKIKVDFKKLVEEKDQLVESLQIGKYQSVLDKNPNIKLISGEAKFSDQHHLNVGDQIISVQKILISTGSESVIPPIAGIENVPYLTSKTAFELQELPETLAVIGGGYIALEIAQMFSRLGTKVTIVQRSEILFQEDDDASAWMTNYLRTEGIEILNHTSVKEINKSGDNVLVNLFKDEESFSKSFSKILIATGRKPNTKNLCLELARVKTNTDGSIMVNEFGQTNIENIYAAGDVLATPALVYVAAYEGNLAAENAFTGNSRASNYDVVPWVIFSDPQIAGIGLNESQAKAKGIEYDISLLELSNVPRAIAARDTRGFIKLLRQTGTDRLIGARIIAPEGAELLMELSLMIRYQLPISEIAKELHPYLTLSEAVKLAAQTFDKDVKSLSCCAV
ncbi:MAG: mercury(II) reductase [Bdellovibrio sp. CG12_big_fil_rev_8_21_14_0_65_39_13]|nr:MAG: mercury(II) reductase [Bdellovibrio sp. CG22_combo_CG10-13_8_21_14_all_39_27]PIQ58581.1 MAG: mercury(II) reductase [Bdellovibrio sp. CG12_big_fil_rev_8_21_14_0_65_39_13]PIR32435.1 MAG: mercury(II) reductase [Bdellovibrio sp. CG11_big_fil_rev_8_21_14_0_20_39_38]